MMSLFYFFNFVSLFIIYKIFPLSPTVEVIKDFYHLVFFEEMNIPGNIVIPELVINSQER